MTVRWLGRWAVAALLLVASPAIAAATSADFDRAAAAARAAIISDPAAAFQRADEAGRIARALDSPRERDVALATVDRLRGEAFMQMDRADRAAPLIAEGLALVRRSAPGSKTEAELLLSSGGVHAGRGELAAAFVDYQASHRIFQAIGDTRDQSLALLSISSLYGDANDFTKSLKYLDQAIAADSSDPRLLLLIYNNRASNLQELGQFAEAESGYRKALALAKRQEGRLLEARILGNIARVRLKAGNVAGADQVLAQALALARVDETGATRLPLVAIEAQAAFEAHDYTRARALIAERFAGVDLATTTIPFREAHQTAYATYRALGDAPRAIEHLAALKRLDDQATRLATSANSALAAAAFDFTNQQLRYERQRARTQRLVFLGIAAGTAIIIVVLGIALVLVRRSRNRVRVVADDLAVTNAALGKALAAKTEFLATTSHEIRTPLNGILGMTQVMLADRTLPADTRERLDLVHGAGVTMRALVDDILDVAKMETGNLTIERAPFDLAATLTGAAKMWAEQARGKGLAFALNLDDAPGWIEGDAARVRQIAFNLLSNALKFTAAGAVSLRASRDGECYRLAVSDTGIGIAADKVEAIFESFKQADAGTTRQFGGTGLGLSICRNLARAMGGDVVVDSVEGKGSTFTVTLPLVAAVATGSSIARDEPEAAQCGGGVVVVDANPITRAMLRTLVAGHCADTVAVASLVEAVPLATGAGLVVVDQSAATNVAVLEALAEAAPVVVLWRGEVPEAIDTTARVVAKPIGGPALIAALFDEIPTASLVPQAA